jgi:mRNA interferase RelE/StbE
VLALSYTLQLKPAAHRQLEKLPRDVQRRVAARIDRLRNDPFPPGCKKLDAIPGAWRIRVGDYRVIYQVHRDILLVLVVTIGHRREVYR